MHRLILYSLLLLLLHGSSYGKIHSWKGAVHISAVPFITGTGIYSDVRILQTADRVGTRAGAITNLSLLSIQTGFGLTILVSDDDLPQVIRFVHRIVGIGVIASAAWISIEGSLDQGVPSVPRYTAYTHTVLAAAPLILFTF